LPRRVWDLPVDAFVMAHTHVRQNLVLSNIAFQ
jgi:hypothetical protein